MVLGAFGAWIGCRRAGVKLTPFLDAAAPGLLLAQAIGRWGNYFNQELFGGPTTLPVGPSGRRRQRELPGRACRPTRCSTPRSSTNPCGTSSGVLILLALDRRFNFRRGRLFCLYAMYYTLGRVWIEAMRIDDAEQISLFGITTRLNVWTSIFVFVGALAVFIVLGRRKGGNRTPLPPGPRAGRRGDPPVDRTKLPRRQAAAAAVDKDKTADDGGKARCRATATPWEPCRPAARRPCRG